MESNIEDLYVCIGLYFIIFCACLYDLGFGSSIGVVIVEFFKERLFVSGTVILNNFYRVEIIDFVDVLFEFRSWLGFDFLYFFETLGKDELSKYIDQLNTFWLHCH